MLSLSHDSENRILLFTASGVLTTDDLGRIKQLAKQFAGESLGHRTIVDLAGVQASAVPDSFLTQCARLPEREFGDRCIVIAPQADLQELVRRYTRDQREVGGTSPDLVVSFRTALEHFDIEIAHFEQLD